MKKVYIISIFCLLIGLMAPLAYSLDFSVEAEPIKDKIDLSEPAEFIISITNEGSDDEFNIRIMNHPYWEAYTEPRVNPISVELKEGEKGEIKVFVRPVHVTNIDTYIVNLKVESKNTNDQVFVPLAIGIKSTEQLVEGFVPTVLLGLNIPAKIDPRNEVDIQVKLNNQNMLDYPELKIILDSNLIKDVITETLGPKEEKVVEYKKKLDDATEPQEDIISITLVRGNKTIERATTNLKIEEYATKSERILKSFLKTERIITITSNNPQYNGLIAVNTTFFKKLFTSTTPKAKDITKGKTKYLGWEAKLNADRTMEIRVVESYRALSVIFVLFVVIVLLYLSLRSPLLVAKSAASIKTKEGGISELSIRLNIKNRGKEKIENLRVSDVVPRIVDIEKEVSIGSLHPLKVLRHEKKGTILKWEVASLDANEERVITYKVKSRLSILGELDLPAAAVIFHQNGKGNIARSNRLSISPEKADNT